MCASPVPDLCAGNGLPPVQANVDQQILDLETRLAGLDQRLEAHWACRRLAVSRVWPKKKAYEAIMADFSVHGTKMKEEADLIQRALLEMYALNDPQFRALPSRAQVMASFTARAQGVKSSADYALFCDELRFCVSPLDWRFRGGAHLLGYGLGDMGSAYETHTLLLEAAAGWGDGNRTETVVSPARKTGCACLENRLFLAMTSKGLWFYGISMHLGDGGFSSGASVFGPAYQTRDEALKAAAIDFTQRCRRETLPKSALQEQKRLLAWVETVSPGATIEPVLATPHEPVSAAETCVSEAEDGPDAESLPLDPCCCICPACSKYSAVSTDGILEGCCEPASASTRNPIPVSVPVGPGGHVSDALPGGPKTVPVAATRVYQPLLFDFA